MRRHAGEKIVPGGNVAVLANDAIGNFVAATPLLQLLKTESKAASVHFWCGTRVAEFRHAPELFDLFLPLHGSSPAELLGLIAEHTGSYDWIINLESTAHSKAIAGLLSGELTFVSGPCVGPGGRGELPFPDDPQGELWADRRWVAEDLKERYPFLRSGFIAEIFARGCYFESEIPPYRVPSQPPGQQPPDLLVATSASLPEKLWPREKWAWVLDRVGSAGYTAGLLGAKPKDQKTHWMGGTAEDELVAQGLLIDLRGQYSLPEVVGALGQCRAVLTLDNGILHLAVAARARTVGLYRHGIHRLWTPPSATLTVLTPGEGREVSEIDPEIVWEAVAHAL
ncbi:MAG: hypothetical protein KJZ62_06750 [Fimbriimonadaceae bacterium]|nr:hypothetical protein [Fimbriimonadaceae bacterium]QOJ12553.1 MAG: hypothetical protein HRU74_11025 [Chthonomonadaceae bacterium]